MSALVRWRRGRNRERPIRVFPFATMQEGQSESQEGLFMYLSRFRRAVVAVVFGLLAVAPAPTRADMVLDFKDLNPKNDDSLYLSGPYHGLGFTVSSTGGFNTYGTGYVGPD